MNRERWLDFWDFTLVLTAWGLVLGAPVALFVVLRSLGISTLLCSIPSLALLIVLFFTAEFIHSMLKRWFGAGNRSVQ